MAVSIQSTYKKGTTSLRTVVYSSTSKTASHRILQHPAGKSGRFASSRWSSAYQGHIGYKTMVPLWFLTVRGGIQRWPPRGRQFSSVPTTEHHKCSVAQGGSSQQTLTERRPAEPYLWRYGPRRKVNALKGGHPAVPNFWSHGTRRRVNALKGGLAHTNANHYHRYDVTNHRVFPNVGMNNEVEFDGRTYKEH